MIAVVTGDIIGSRSVATDLWLPKLKEGLSHYGTTPLDWEIYRGDSFQSSLKPELALEAILLLKAKFKQFPNLDIRAAIGIGEQSYQARNITESNGEAFVNSGECFEQMKGNLAIQTPWDDYNQHFSIAFSLSDKLIEQWTAVSSKIIEARLHYPQKTQQELAELLNTKQPLISNGLSRAHFKEISRLNQYYKTQLRKRC